MPVNSTRKRRSRNSSQQPKKPYDGFPLYAHPLGYWSKNIDGRILHIGRWGRVVKRRLARLPYNEGWRAALNLFNSRDKDARNGDIAEVVVQPVPKHDESESKADDGEMRIVELLNRFLTSKQRKLRAREPAARSFGEYREATDMIAEKFGTSRRVSRLKPCDFELLRVAMAKRWGPARLRKFIILVRSVFRYAAKNGLIERPVNFGSEFDPPGKAVRRRHQATRGKKLFTREEVRTILDALDGREVKLTGKRRRKTFQAAPNPKLRAAILFGINAGLGNTDISELQHAHLDLRGGWLKFERPKTGLPRRTPLWTETVAAIRAAMKLRSKPKSPDDAGCVFLNRGGRRMVISTTTAHSDYVSNQFGALLHALGINGRGGLGFYSLRHTFATVGLETRDRDAVKAIMGHLAGDMLAEYDETGPSDERLRAVTDHVHAWLFGDEAEGLGGGV